MNKTNTKKSTLRRSAFGLLALVTAFVAETAFAGAWSCQRLTEANPLPEAVNLLRGRLPTASSCDGTNAWAEAYATRFTDGKITIAEDWWYVQLKSGGAYVCYSVTDDPAGVALTSVRFTTTHQDKGRSQVRIAKLSVQTVTSGETWVELADSSVIGPEPQPGETNFQAVYAESDGRPIAEGVTAIRLDFDPKQQNDSIGVSEIEATALFLDGAWTCRRQKAAYALLPSANVLRDAEPAVSPDRMSVTYPLRDDGLALGGVRITSSPADGSRLSVASLQVKTVATGDSWYALPGSGIVTNEAGASAWEAFYANPENLPLAALGITALKVVFADGSAAGEAGLPVVEATEAGAASWSCRPLAEANPLPAVENALLGREPTAFACNGEYPYDVNAALFTDGMIELKKDGWSGRIMDGGAFVSYRLSDSPNGTRVRNVRVTTTHMDKARAEVRIDALLVKTVSGGETWFALPNAIVVGPDVTVQLANNQATYARADGAFLVLDATDLRIEFCVEQQNGWVGISEIEAACKPYRGLAVIIR